MKNDFTIIPADDFIWNQTELLKFLIKHQNQDIVIGLNSEGPCCKKLGLYEILDLFEFKSVTILTCNKLEQHNRYSIVRKSSSFFNVRGSVDPQYHTWNSSQIFGAFFGRPLWHRIGLASYLRARYANISLVGLRGDYRDDNARALFEIESLIKNVPDIICDFANLVHQLPMIPEESDTYAPGVTDSTAAAEQLKKYYKNILIDIVSETFVSGNTFFPTEKTFRPMLLKKPFIIMGPVNNLIYLRQMGFKTFHEFWDEDYDGFPPKQKFQKITDLIDALASKTRSELMDMYEKMQPILNYNYDLLINQTYNKHLTQIND